MAVVYIITNTEGSDEFAIQPQTLNGPDGVQQNTDLRLPGNGLAIWGEAYNENVYRLLESFALPEKGSSPGVPQDAGDLGTGNGINVPLEGQIWWNKTQKKLFVFGGTDWNEPNVVGIGPTGDVPVTCSDGDLFFDITEQQLLVCGGSGFISVADQYLRLDGTRPMEATIDMNGFAITDLPLTPAGPSDATSKDYVDITFLKLDASNDPMTANLDMDGNEVENLPTPGLGTGGAEGASRDYVENAIDSLSLSALTGDIRMTIDSSITVGWLPCDGTLMGNAASGQPGTKSSNANEALFDLLNIAGVWGNPGGAVFANGDTVLLPDMNGRSPMGQGQSDAPRLVGVNATRIFGSKGGSEVHKLTVPEMPSHSHGYRFPSSPFPHDTHVHNRLTVPSPPPIGQTSPTGGDGEHANVHPFLTLNFLVKT